MATMKLHEYIIANCERGACQCGRCADALAHPEQHQPSGHTADLVFFKVRAKEGADAETLRTLIKEQRGEFCECDLFDGKEHNYMEVGGWVGDQGMALMLMGLGSLLGLWRLLTPRTMLGSFISEEQAMQMAGVGYVAVQAA